MRLYLWLTSTAYSINATVVGSKDMGKDDEGGAEAPADTEKQGIADVDKQEAAGADKQETADAEKQEEEEAV